ncbi:MAG: cytochrome D ubiquinol oxidase subunit II, partial [Acidimicrobiia bacterium]|nr:cytochrome D ubiquinol oxidase subunit II [Acidimicrobiia bacterium]
ADAICDFYRNYQSQRYVNGQLVLRMLRGPDDDMLELLNDEFSDIVVAGRIERVGPSPSEIADNDASTLDRISFEFNRRHFGRLRQLINKLNQL